MWTDLAAWLRSHDTTIDLVTVWMLTLGFLGFSFVKVVSWFVLRNQQDQTSVGGALKAQKIGEAIVGAAMAALYGLSLPTYYQNFVPDFWERLILRSVVLASMIGASVSGIRFVVALIRESRRPRMGAAPLLPSPRKDWPPKGDATV